MSYKADLKNIPIELIDRNPENPRIFFRQEEMEQLYVSIKNKGLLQPIAVYKDKDRYVILDGERRYKTFLKLNYPTIPAIIQDKPSVLDNLLLMFNIHSTREQWDIFTIAMKIERVLLLLKDTNGSEPTESELSEETGMTRGVIRRCKMIIALPERFKDLLRTELEKPKKDQLFSEDFFLEMENSLKTVKNNFPETIKKIDVVRDVLISKYLSKIINNVTDFRKLTKIATANKNLNVSKEIIETSLISIFQDNSTSIENVYRETVENLYGDRIITNNATNFLYKLENLNAKDIQDSGLRETLIRIKNQIENLIKE
jgi:ParB family transcriptional regulator, chromosome partitioning protein